MSSHVGAINSVNALISKVFRQPKGDLADRVNSRWTVCILALSSVLMLSGHFMGDPITCWIPAQFTKQWSDFVNQYCYVHGTYFVPLDKGLEFDSEERKKIPITYYQWVPYILAVQAFLFYIPRVMWKTLIGHSGYDLSGAIQYVDGFWDSIKNNDAGFKARVAAFECRASTYIWDGLRLARKKRSRDMAMFYTFANFFQCFNACAQFMWLNALLDSPIYNFWGPGLFWDLISGDDWQTTGHFPRITHCDFNMRRPASVQLDTVLCVLGLNIYYEKLFLFLWFWFFFVAIISFVNFAYSLAGLCDSRQTRKVIDSYLSSQANLSDVSREQFYRALGKDGMFVLQQMSLNLGDIPASYLTLAMRNCANQVLDDQSDNEESVPLKSFKGTAKDV